MAYDGSLKFDTKINTKGFNSGTKNLTGQMGTLVKGIKAVGVAIATSFVVKGIKATIDAAEELQNAMTGLKSIMDGQGKSFSRAQQFINQYTEDGLIPASNAITAYKNLALRGYNTDQIEKVMIALKDSATYGRQASYTLGEAVQSASEGLKNENSILVDNAGVTKNVAKMWEEYAKSIGKTRNNLTQAEKIQAEVNGILEETKFQTGDAATYMNSYSGQVARLQQQWLTFKQTIGGAFMTLAQAVLPAINTIISALIKMAQVFAAVINALFGKLIKVNDNVANSAKNAASGITDMGTAASEAGKAANEALLPFDNLNVLQEETGSGSSGGGGGGGASFGMEDATSALEIKDIDTSGVDKYVNAITTKIQGLKDFLDTNSVVIKSILAGIAAGLAVFAVIKGWGTISGILTGIGAALSTAKVAFVLFFQGIAEGSGVMTTLTTIFGSASAAATAIAAAIAVAIAAIVAALAYLYQTSEPFRTAVNEALTNLWNILQKIWTEILQPLFTFIADVFNTILVPIGKWLVDVFVTAVDVVFSALLSLWNNILSPIASFLVDILSIALQGVLDIWEAWKPTIEKVMGKLKDVWDNVLKPIVTWFKDKLIKTFETFGPIVQKVLDTVKGVFQGLVDFLVGVFTLDIDKMWQGIQKIFNTFKDFLTGIFEKDWSESFGAIGDVINSFLGIIKTIWETIKGYFNGIITFIKGVFTGNWKEALGGLTSAFSSIFNGIVNIAKGVFNLVIGVINTLLEKIESGINTIIGTINGVTATVGINAIPTVSLPRIPKLATGAVIPPNAEFMAVLGDQKNGRNLEAPENLIRQIVREETAELANRPIYVKAQISGKTLMNIIAEQQTEKDRATGYTTGGGVLAY